MTPLISASEVLTILKLARAGTLLSAMVKRTGKQERVIRQICDAVGIRIREPLEPLTETHTEAKGLKYEQGSDESRYSYALRILNDEGKITHMRGIHYLNGKQLRPLEVMQEANRILKANELPQIQGQAEWMV